MLDSVTASVSLADVVTVCERFDEEVCITYNGEKSKYENDSVLKAIRSLWARFGVFGIDVSVDKRLPEGGASAARARTPRQSFSRATNFSAFIAEVTPLRMPKGWEATCPS